MMDSGHCGGQLRANRALWDPRRKGLQLLSERIHWRRWPISFALQISQFWNERSKLLAAFYTIFNDNPSLPIPRNYELCTKLYIENFSISSALHQSFYIRILWKNWSPSLGFYTEWLISGQLYTIFNDKISSPPALIAVSCKKEGWILQFRVLYGIDQIQQQVVKPVVNSKRRFQPHNQNTFWKLMIKAYLDHQPLS